MKPLFTNDEWSFELLDKTWDVIDDIAKNRYGLDYYKPQIEIISADQMLDAYCSHAMPIMYNHWSFGKAAAKLKQEYDHGIANLAYEVVINTDPCIAYLMENNTMTMQTLVMAHAAVGHSSFFKTNYMFKEHTNASGILDYLRFAKKYIAECEKEHGSELVEYLIDCCHALQYQSVDRYPRKVKSEEDIKAMKMARAEDERQRYDPVFDTIKNSRKVKDKRRRRSSSCKLPEDNLLYFIEKNSLILEDWEKEIVRIIRTIGQYFYPQMLTKCMNEGTATFWHYTLMQDLCDEGYLTEGQRLSFLQSHCGVVNQQPYNSQYYGGLNPYTIGYSIFQDVRRICENPTAEDKEYMPHLIGKDWLETVKDMTASYKDSSFIANFLSPKIVRDLKLFVLADDCYKLNYEVTHTHNKNGFVELRRTLSKAYEWDSNFPSFKVTKFIPTIPRVKMVHTDFLERDLSSSNKTRAAYDCIMQLMGCDVDLDLNEDKK